MVLITTDVNASPLKSLITIKCGERPVAHAKVDFREYENDHHKHHHKDLQDVTDAHGHIPLKDGALYRLKNAENDIKICVKDACMLETVPHKCNLSYSQFEVSIKDLPFIGNQELLLDLTQWKFDVKCV